MASSNPPPYTKARDHGNRRSGEIGDGTHGLFDRRVILDGQGRVSPLLLELGDVCPGRKGLGPGAAENHHPHLGVRPKLGHIGTKALPHVVGDGVTLGRSVDGYRGNAVLDN